MAVYCYTVALTAATKAETFEFRLRDVQKKLRAVLHSAESLIFISANSQPYDNMI
jgi:hypothetical protein